MPDEIARPNSVQFIAYKWRWYVLVVASLANVSNAMVWISFSAILNYSTEFYGRSQDDITYFSTVFFIATIPLGILTMVLIDTAGLRIGILVGAILNAIGSIIRAISTLHFVAEHDMFWASMLGQTVAAIAQPFILIIPTKVAELWFPESQRAIATTVISMANPLGIIIGVGFPPLIVKSTEDIRLLNILISIPCVIAAVLAIFGIRTSVPPTPPSHTALTEVRPAYLANLKQLLLNIPYLILAVALGTGLGGVSALVTMLQEFTCSRGYGDEFTGLCGALLIFCGLIGAGIAGAAVDKTKKFTLVTKVCFAMASVCSIFLVLAVRERNFKWAIALSCSLFGFFGFAAYPVGLELGVETSYPVPEATSSGVIIVLGQLVGVLLVQGMKALRQPLTPHEMMFEKCTIHSSSNATASTVSNTNNLKAHNMTVPGIIFSSVLTAVTIILLIFFKTEYKRMKAETINQAQMLISGTHPQYSSRPSLTESGQFMPPIYS